MTDEVIQDIKQICQALPIVSNMVSLLRKRVSDPNFDSKKNCIELEAKFGKLVESEQNTLNKQSTKKRTSFKPGVSITFADKIKKDLLENYTNWYTIKPFDESKVYFYNINHSQIITGQDRERPRNRGNQTLRSIVTYDDSCEYEKKIITNTCQKNKIASADFRYQLLNKNNNNYQQDDQWDVRITLCEEIITDPRIKCVKPHKVRIRQRTSYLYKPENTALPIWSFDITLVWEGNSSREAETSQQSGVPPIIEIEIELLNADYYTTLPNITDDYIALSLLMKIEDLLGKNGNFLLQPVQQSL